MRRLRLALAALAALAAAAPALAAPVELRDEVVSEDGKVTLGDLFDNAGAASAVVVARSQPGTMVVLDAGRIELLARANGLDWTNDRGLRRIIAQPGGGSSAEAARAPAASAGGVKRVRAAQTLTFVHNLEAGEVIQSQDLSWSKTADQPLDAPRDPDVVIGMAARHAIREGAAVSLHDVVAPQVIKKDDMVSVVFNLKGIALTLQAKALENAVVGQPVSVVNTVSKKVIQAVATGPGQAVVGPEADLIKANYRSSLSRLASR